MIEPRSLRMHRARRDGSPFPVGRDEMWWRVLHRTLPAQVIAALVLDYTALPEPFVSWVRSVAETGVVTAPPDPSIVTYPMLEHASTATVSDRNPFLEWHRARTVCRGIRALNHSELAAHHLYGAIPADVSGEAVRERLRHHLRGWEVCRDCMGTRWARRGGFEFPCGCGCGLVRVVAAEAA